MFRESDCDPLWSMDNFHELQKQWERDRKAMSMPDPPVVGFDDSSGASSSGSETRSETPKERRSPRSFQTSIPSTSAASPQFGSCPGWFDTPVSREEKRAKLIAVIVLACVLVATILIEGMRTRPGGGSSQGGTSFAPAPEAPGRSGGRP